MNLELKIVRAAALSVAVTSCLMSAGSADSAEHEPGTDRSQQCRLVELLINDSHGGLPVPKWTLALCQDHRSSMAVERHAGEMLVIPISSQSAANYVRLSRLPAAGSREGRSCNGWWATINSPEGSFRTDACGTNPAGKQLIEDAYRELRSGQGQCKARDDSPPDIYLRSCFSGF